MGRARTWWARALLALVGLFALPSPAAANSLPGRALAVCVARVERGDPLPRMLDPPAARFDCARGNRPPGDYWARAVALPARAGAAGPLDLRFASLWQDRTAVAVRYADGAVAITRLDPRALSRRLHLGAIVTVPLPDRHVTITRILWRLDGAAALRAVVALPTLATPAETARSDLMLAGLYAGFAGLCVALLIYNLALYAVMRHRFQLIYCGMVLALLGYACTISGLFAWIVPGLDNNDRLRLNYVLLALSAASALLFARSFFERRVFAGWLGRAADVVAGLPVLAALAFAIGAPHAIGLLDRAFSLSFLPLFAIVAPMLWRAWRRRSDYVWLFAIAWAMPVVTGLLRIAAGLRLLSWNLWIDQSTMLSMALEALLSSLAIAYRIRLLAHERDEARDREVAARLLADTDPLTGLLNRRAFLSRAIGRAGEQTLLVLDIDHFKRVNDTIGHDGGDEVLRVVARALRAAVPPGGLVARFGGEEFAVVTDSAGAVPAVDLLDALRAARMPFDVTVTASVGACTGPLGREADWKAMYRRADQALFAAKAAGRDRARDAGRIAA